MNKIAWILVVIAVGGYFTNSFIQEKIKQKQLLMEEKRAEEIIKENVAQITSSYNAVDNWPTILSKGERYRSETILTIELEKLWLQERPILFIGSIKDIATHDNSQYSILIERNLNSSFKYSFPTELQLSLTSSQERINSFLQNHPNIFKKYEFDNSVAVVAKVNSIRTVYAPRYEGVHREIRIGDGQLLEIVYTGPVLF